MRALRVLQGRVVVVGVAFRWVLDDPVRRAVDNRSTRRQHRLRCVSRILQFGTLAECLGRLSLHWHWLSDDGSLSTVVVEAAACSGVAVYGVCWYGLVVREAPAEWAGVAPCGADGSSKVSGVGVSALPLSGVRLDVTWRGCWQSGDMVGCDSGAARADP